MMIQKIILSIVFGFMINNASAQSNFTWYNLNNTAQSQYLNPAFRTSSKFGFSFAPISNVFNIQFINSGFSIKDVLSTNPNNDSLDLTIENVLDGLKDVNFIDLNIQNELLAFNFSTKKSNFSFTINNIVKFGFSYPKDLLKLAYYGNGGTEFLGKRASFNHLGVDALSYLEIGFGFNRKINKKLVIGGKIKYLKGIANVQTKRSEFGLYTDPKTFALEVDGAFTLNTYNSEELKGMLNNTSDPSFIFNSLKASSNKGIGFDFGVTYEVSKKINLSASVIDLGSIRWKDNVTNYTVNEFKFNYKGVDLVKYLNDTTAYFDELKDSLKEIATVHETNNAYTTNLYSKVYLGGSFDITKYLNIGAIWYNSFNPTRYITGVNLSANVKLKHWLAASVNVSKYNYKSLDVGLGVSFRGGPFQMFVISDNIIAVISPESTKNIHFNFGFSFQIKKSHEYKKGNWSVL